MDAIMYRVVHVPRIVLYQAVHVGLNYSEIRYETYKKEIHYPILIQII